MKKICFILVLAILFYAGITHASESTTVDVGTVVSATDGGMITTTVKRSKDGVVDMRLHIFDKYIINRVHMTMTTSEIASLRALLDATLAEHDKQRASANL